MTRIESKTVEVSTSIQDCYAYLSDMNNYKELLPLDKISDWNSSEKSCSFKIQKTYKLELIHEGGTEFSIVNIKSGESSPFKFDLTINLNETGAGTSAQLTCEADINPFLKMMVEKPLNNLFNYMADRLVKVKG